MNMQFEEKVEEVKKDNFNDFVGKGGRLSIDDIKNLKDDYNED